LFTWRRQVRDGLLVAPPPATFVPVRMLPSEGKRPGSHVFRRDWR
jgi:hypothetical protein